MTDRTAGTPLIGTVAGRDVPVGLLDRRLAAMRRGPFADRLPPADGPEGRRLRRFVAQLLLTEELVRVESARLGIAVPEGHSSRSTPDVTGTGRADESGGPGGFGGAGGSGGASACAASHIDPAGGLAAAVLAAMPLARALHRHVTAAVVPPEERLIAYYHADPDRWHRPERRTVLHVLTPERPRRVDTRLLDALSTRWTCTRDELPPALAEAVFSATQGDLVGPVVSSLGWHLCRVDGVEPAIHLDFETVRDDILARLTRVERDRYFELWLEQRRRDIVATEPGYEHPGDPRHPDYTHHH
jgi:[acyl-carrier-protein] S-malonyltransferase